MFKWMDKKIITIVAQNICLSGHMYATAIWKIFSFWREGLINFFYFTESVFGREPYKL